MRSNEVPWGQRPAGLGFVVMATAVTAIGGFLSGYDTAVISGAISYLKAHMGLDAAQEGMAGASAILGCIPGAMCGGVPLRSVRSREDALPLCRALRGFRHSLRSTPDLRAIPHRAVSERVGDRTVVDHLPCLHRRDLPQQGPRPGHVGSLRPPDLWDSVVEPSSGFRLRRRSSTRVAAWCRDR